MNKTEVHGDIIVHHPSKEQEDDGYCISYSGGGWMPGVFDSVESAVRGGECCFFNESKFVKEIQEPINHFDMGNRLITMNDMDGFTDE